jgi:hypothetical protein
LHSVLTSIKTEVVGGDKGRSAIREVFMLRRYCAAIGVVAVLSIPAGDTFAQDVLGGALLGGAAGAIVGGAVGGNRGAATGAIVGATTGAAIAARGQRRNGGYYYYNRGCYVRRIDGAWLAVAPGYCAVAGAPVPIMQPRPRCMRSPTYDPYSGTYIARDGFRYPCP